MAKGTRPCIAVSGGVDSMALAALCSDLTRYRPAKQRFDFSFKPIIIDHKAREGSSEEVKRVRRRLRRMGFSSSVKCLTWPDSISPLELSDFETQARRLRYQALGEACREQLIQYLLLAHHNDDQAETVLMRLASGHKGTGVQGMPSYGDIPECWGLHGVHRSGRRDMAALRLRREDEKDPSSPRARELRQIFLQPDVFEKGGVQIFRPLLVFGKERLIETCRTRALPWEEDKTNKDTWRTPRNNIRALLHSAKLPQALQKESLLHFAKQTSDYFLKAHTTVAKMLANCEILLLDARCGGLIVRLPRTLVTRRGAEASRVYMGKVWLTALTLLQRFARIVTPQEEVSLQSLEQAAVSIFPDLNDREVAADRTLQPTNFTLGGVQFQRLRSPLAEPRSESDPAISGKWEDLDPLFVWSLTRQPFSKAPLSFTVQPSTKTDSSIATNLPSWSSWHLWDGRYWIRLLNRSCRPLTVRSFQPSDLQYLRSILSPQRYKEFHEFLHLAVPGKVRWTLLALAEIGEDSLPMGRLVALPTLGQAGTFDSGDTYSTKDVEWQLRYKRVGLGYLISNDGNSKISRNRSNLVTSWQD